MEGRLQDKIALVTGGSRGIGRATCQALAREGAAVVVAARSEAAIGAVAAAIRESGGRAEALPVDVTDPASVARLVAAVLERFGRLDILVNSHGYYKASRFVDYALEDWKRIVEVNLHGTFICCQAVLPHMLQRRSGKIINMSSTAGKWGSLLQSAYNASKHAIMGLTRSLALEVADQGITVNAVCPGWVETEMLEQLKGEFAAIWGVDVETAVARMTARIPQGRFLRPEEVAEAVVYLASPAADGITGIGLTLAGGLILI